MARMNISVPDELKARMDDINTNWSAVAAVAFELEVRQRERIDKMDRGAVVERLRATYEKDKSRQFDVGHEAGVAWASEEAEASELMSLNDAAGIEDAADFLRAGRYDETAFEKYSDAASFFEEALGSEPVVPSTAWVRGFVTGALEVWEQVEDEVVE